MQSADSRSTCQKKHCQEANLQPDGFLFFPLLNEFIYKEQPMDKQGFQEMLKTRNLNEAQIKASIAIAERFEQYLSDKELTEGNAWAFSMELIKEGQNTRENYLALARYCLFIKNTDMYVAILELVDGGEVGENLYRKIGEFFGEELREEVFAGIGVAPYGTPTPNKPAYIHPVIERLESKVGEQDCKDFLSACLRDLPDEGFLAEREEYNQAQNIDEFLIKRKQAFLAELEACKNEQRLFFAQEITDEVLDFVRSIPDMGGGVRVGDIIYETKIPYMTKKFLAEKDPALRGFYGCHCPWARYALINDNVKLKDTFCNCSAGFHKKAFEVIFGQKLKVDVLKSILKGDDCCRFAIHLPKELV
jgi:hypothetical protein